MKVLLLVLLFLFLLVLMIALYFLISPFRIMVNTDKGTYRAGWSHLASVRLSEENNDWGVRFNLLGWSRRYGLEQLLFRKKSKEPQKVEAKEKPRSSKSKRRSSFSIERVGRILRQVHVREFRMDLDTDDVIANAYLTPVFEGLRFWTRGRCQTRVNFIGHNRLIINVDTRMINLLRAGYL